MAEDRNICVICNHFDADLASLCQLHNFLQYLSNIKYISEFTRQFEMNWTTLLSLRQKHQTKLSRQRRSQESQRLICITLLWLTFQSNNIAGPNNPECQAWAAERPTLPLKVLAAQKISDCHWWVCDAMGDQLDIKMQCCRFILRRLTC